MPRTNTLHRATNIQQMDVAVDKNIIPLDEISRYRWITLPDNSGYILIDTALGRQIDGSFYSKKEIRYDVSTPLNEPPTLLPMLYSELVCQQGDTSTGVYTTTNTTTGSQLMRDNEERANE